MQKIECAEGRQTDGLAWRDGALVARNGVAQGGIVLEHLNRGCAVEGIAMGVEEGMGRKLQSKLAAMLAVLVAVVFVPVVFVPVIDVVAAVILVAAFVAGTVAIAWH